SSDVCSSDLALAGHLVLHLLQHRLHRLLQLVERVGLRPDGLPRHPLPERLGGIAHRPLGASERLRDLAGPLAHLAHHLAEHAAERLLLLRGVAHVDLALLALLTLAPLLPLLAALALLLAALRAEAAI